MTMNASSSTLCSRSQWFQSVVVYCQDFAGKMMTSDDGCSIPEYAKAFIDDNAHRDIALDDIANAVYVTPRSVQYMFRKHLDCTPIAYLRQVRLHHAHQDLLSGTRSTTTVTTVASRWGFGHAGRFAVYYRQVYGQSPHTTLRSDP